MMIESYGKLSKNVYFFISVITLKKLSQQPG